MDNTKIIILVVAGLVAVALVAAFLLLRRRQSAKLRARFGPEYAVAVGTSGGRGKAESELNRREKRVASFDIAPLTPGDRERFIAAWAAAQAAFVDNPQGSVNQADDLLGQVMSARRYPVADFEQQAADLSVDHPAVVQNYRAAHEIARRQKLGDASTEDLRRAIVHFRALFEDLVNEPAVSAPKSA